MAWKKWNTNFRFPFNQNVWFEFSATSSSEWSSIFQNFQKREQPREALTSRGIGLLYEVHFFPEVFFPFNFAPGVFRLSVSAISEIQQFPEFLETFPGNFCTIWLCFQIFESFGWMESALESTMFHFSSEVLLQKYRSSETGAPSIWCSTAY